MEPPDFPPPFHPITVAWFRRRFGAPSPPQRLGWPLIAQRQHTLILSPTAAICRCCGRAGIMDTSPQHVLPTGGQG